MRQNVAVDRGKEAIVPHFSTLSLTVKPKKERRFPIGKISGYILLLVIAFLYVFPLLYLVNVALKTPEDFLFNPSGLTKAIDLTNFSQAWVQGNFAQYLVNSMFYTVTATFISVTLSVLVAFPIARGYVKWSNVWYTFFLAAIFLPAPLIPQFQLILNMGLYGTQLSYILVNASLGLGPLLIVGYLRSVPKELDEAARIDGCGYFRFLFRIIVPLIRPILVTVLLLGAINVWNDIINATIYLDNSDLYTVSLGLFSFYGQYQNQWTILAAAVFIMATPLIILYIFLQRYFMDGALAGSLK